MKVIAVLLVITLIIGAITAAWFLRAEIKRALKIYSPRAKEWAQTDGKVLANKAAEALKNRRR